MDTVGRKHRMIQEHLQNGTYAEWYKEHLHNTIYRPLIDRFRRKASQVKITIHR